MADTKSMSGVILTIGAFVMQASLFGQTPKTGMDKEFYNDYLDSLPNEYAQKKETLENNLIRVIKRVVPREDPINGKDRVKNVKPGEFVYEQVDNKSPFVRGIFKELPTLRPTKFMYVIKMEPYHIFVTFEVDPKRMIVMETQSKTLIKEPKNQNEHP